MSGVLLVGDVIDDVLVRPGGPIAPDTDTPSRIERTAGGSAANTACWLAAAGAAASLVATVGGEDLERHRTLLEAQGVRALLTTAPVPTGTIVVLSQGEHRAMLTDRGANAATGPELVGEFGAVAHLHLAGHVLAGEDRDAGWRALLDRAALAGLTRSVAPGSVALLAEYGPGRFRALTSGVEVLPANRDEALLLTGEDDPAAAAAVLGRDHRVVTVTLGSAGALVAAGGSVVHVPAVPVRSVDVTGAGDAFAAGLLEALLAGADPVEAARAGTRLAARAVTTVGARPRSVVQ